LATRAGRTSQARQNIIDAAMREFAERGSQARIDEIAAKTKSSKRMIYYYFGGKDWKQRPGSAVVFVPVALLRCN
jgi:AcrR family transcriptional regulator